jgi:hypothetical protein
MKGSDIDQSWRRLVARRKPFWAAGLERAGGRFGWFYRIARYKPEVFDPHPARIGDGNRA